MAKPLTLPLTLQLFIPSLSCWLVEARRIFLHDIEADPRVGIPIWEEAGALLPPHPKSALSCHPSLTLAAVRRDRMPLTGPKIYDPPASAAALLSQHPRSALSSHMNLTLAAAHRERVPLPLTGRGVYGPPVSAAALPAMNLNGADTSLSRKLAPHCHELERSWHLTAMNLN
jgi:hypothetical protein